MLFKDLNSEKQNEIIDTVKSLFSFLDREDLYRVSEEDYDWTDDYFYELFYGIPFEYEYGATKVVFAPRELDDWVIKVPIFGVRYCPEGEADNSSCEIEYTNANNYCPVPGNNYCAAEEYITTQLLSENEEFKKYFISTEYLTTINNVPVYISEKISGDYYDSGSPTQDSLKKAKQVYNERSSSDDWATRLYPETLAYFIDSYGQPQTEQLLDFLNEYHICDLHHGNLGFDANERIKIIDCAGFFD